MVHGVFNDVQEAKRPKKVPCLRGDYETYGHLCDYDLIASRDTDSLASAKFYLLLLKHGTVPDSAHGSDQRLGSQTQVGKAIIA